MMEGSNRPGSSLVFHARRGPADPRKTAENGETPETVKTPKTAKPLKRRNDGVRVAPLHRRLKR
jgi:hypothetical protein